MANNRMYLVNKRTGDKIYLAKYYPTSGWYTTGDVTRRMDETFVRADFSHLNEEQIAHHYCNPSTSKECSSAGMWGDEWELEYEIRSDG